MRKDYKNILVPVDFKEPATLALKYAYNLARQINGEIIILNVWEMNSMFVKYFSMEAEIHGFTDKLKEKLEKLVDAVKIKGAEIPVHTEVIIGKPYEKILEIAETKQARMIVLGENHQGETHEQDLGSTVYHVTLKSPVPVLTLKGETISMGDKIVVPLDLTLKTGKQLFSALVYGLNFGAKIHLVSSLVGGIKMHQSRIYKKLKNARATLLENGVDCEIKIFERSETPPHRRIMQYAEDIDADMILVMTHKEGYTFDNYIGAFAHHIINKSKVPVLSLTSSATNLNFQKMFTDIIDPLNMLYKK